MTFEMPLHLLQLVKRLMKKSSNQVKLRNVIKPLMLVCTRFLRSVKSKWPCQRSSISSNSGVEEVASPLGVVGEEVGVVCVDAILLAFPSTLN